MEYDLIELWYYLESNSSKLKYINCDINLLEDKTAILKALKDKFNTTTDQKMKDWIKIRFGELL
jgi:hypothetical protein